MRNIKKWNWNKKGVYKIQWTGRNSVDIWKCLGDVTVAIDQGSTELRILRKGKAYKKILLKDWIIMKEGIILEIVNSKEMLKRGGKNERR